LKLQNLALLIALVFAAPAYAQTSLSSPLGDTLSKPEKRVELSQDFEDRLLFHRAFEAVLWSLPAADALVMRQAAEEMGLGSEALFYTKNRPTGKQRYITYNASAPYVFGTFTTYDTPLVMEVPAAAGSEKFSGSIFDLWFLPMVDIGPLGNDKGNGAKYFITGPGWEGEVPAGFTHLPSRTNHIHMLFRGLSNKEGDAGWEAGREYAKTLKVYKYRGEGEPALFKFIDSSNGPFSGVPAMDLSFFNYIDQLVQEEPALEHDKAMMGLLYHIGFRRGEDFNPNEQQRAILEDAVRAAQSWLIGKMENNDAFGAPFWPDRTYRTLSFTPDVIEGGAQWVFDDRVDYLWRAYGWYYYGVGIQQRVGAAATYLTATQDSAGKVLDGSKTYKITLPPNVPIDDFWEVIGYSTWTRSYIDTEANRINVNSKQPDLIVGKDGSVDVFIGPSAPVGMEPNWISTRADEGYFIGLRFYGPQQALYDLEWTPSDPVLLQ
jgi:hypothetical protein